MKRTARLLLVVALLLPFRGAVASAGVLCHLGGFSPATVGQAHEPGHGGDAHAATAIHHHGDRSEPVSLGHAHHAADEHVPLVAGTPGSASMCDLCSSVCAAPALPGHETQLVAVVPATGERFPSVSPPRAAATFGGLERPPRSA